VHNIVLNAVQAMAGAGCVRLRAANLAPGAEVGLPPGGSWVKVSLSDNGPGMPPEVMSRIFDPFFTTKEEGTGLGLATSHTIMEKHQGRLRVESTPGAGTTFHLILPAATRPLAA
jgi:signal transduction histidine kinase